MFRQAVFASSFSGDVVSLSHRIAEQVGNDLAEAANVANQEFRETRIDADDHFEVLLGDSGRYQHGDIFHGLGEPVRRWIERQLAGINFRKSGRFSSCGARQ
jgi:hypothetical protein